MANAKTNRRQQANQNRSAKTENHITGGTAVMERPEESPAAEIEQTEQTEQTEQQPEYFVADDGQICGTQEDADRWNSMTDEEKKAVMQRPQPAQEVNEGREDTAPSPTEATEAAEEVPEANEETAEATEEVTEEPTAQENEEVAPADSTDESPAVAVEAAAVADTDSDETSEVAEIVAPVNSVAQASPAANKAQLDYLAIYTVTGKPTKMGVRNDITSAYKLALATKNSVQSKVEGLVMKRGGVKNVGRFWQGSVTVNGQVITHKVLVWSRPKQAVSAPIASPTVAANAPAPVTNTDTTATAQESDGASDSSEE